jgi:hypothetical protein
MPSNSSLRPLAVAALALVGAIALLAPIAAAAPHNVWERTFDLHARPSLTVQANDGSVHVSTWERKSIQVRVSTRGWNIGTNGVEIVDRQDGDDVHVTAHEPQRWFSFDIGNRSVTIEVFMPRDADLAVSSGDGNLDIGALRGNVRLHSGDGTIQAIGLAGIANIETGDGRIVVADFDGTLDAHTGDGSMELDGRFDGLRLSSGDGPVRASARAGSRMKSDWEVRTGDGSVTLRVPADLHATIDAHTGDGGIDVGLPVEVSGRFGRSTLHGTINGGGPTLLLRTGDGSIRIEKS